MDIPTCTVPGVNVAEVTVPPGWSTEYSFEGRKPYLQTVFVSFDQQIESRWFKSSWGHVNERMKPLENTQLPPRTNTLKIFLSFQYANVKPQSPKKPQLQPSASLEVVTDPSRGPITTVKKGDSVIFHIFVKDIPNASSASEASDTIATISCVNTIDPPPPSERATFEAGASTINDFQANTGIPDEDLRPGPPYTPPPHLANLPVGIIGAGAAGLYTAMILDSLGIKYQILEGSGRHGGRLYTHEFSDSRGSAYQYFDAGAMRYPDVFVMKRTFDLVRNQLNIGHKLIPVIMSNDNCILHYNGRGVTKKDYRRTDQSGSTSADTFGVGKTRDNVGGYVPEDFLKQGHAQLYKDTIEPLRQYFVRLPFAEAFLRLMQHDKHSVRDYMANAMGYPTSVIRWIETMEWRTGMFDASLVETVLASLSFEDPRSEAEGKNGDWYCFDGGSRILANAMLEKVRTKPKYHQRVTAIQEVAEDDNQAILVEINTSGGPNLSSSGVSTSKYSNVISTLPLSVLRTVDLDKVYLSLGQKCAFRELLYSPSVKVGIQFRTCWWQTLQIEGGQSYTDRPSRAVVYPSYGPGLDGSKFSNVLIASYNGMQDSQRLGAFIRGHGSAEEKILLNLVMKDLAVVHNKPIDELWGEYMDYFAWDWYGNTFSQGAFAWFGPGQFKEVYPHVTMPASKKQRLFFAGDATSTCHGWVAGALNSAWRCVREMLVAHPELNPNPGEDIMQKFTTKWGASEEWDDKTLAKHVYLGRELFNRQQRGE